ncbi:MAG: hypothetical protein MI924_18320, partial [Chloroflexales bacterium]|nr:hypothetical protein [Chloroflexales bacterium]
MRRGAPDTHGRASVRVALRSRLVTCHASLVTAQGAVPHASREGALTILSSALGAPGDTSPMFGMSQTCGAEPRSLPLTPPQSPPWSPARGGSDVVGGSCGYSACLRCDVWMSAGANGRLVAQGHLV